MNNIYIEEEVGISEEMKKALKDGITKVAEAEKLSAFEVCVLVCSKERIAELNLDMRGISSPTDVLSFPNLEFDENFNVISDADAEKDPETGAVYLGDIAVCPDVINEHAEEYGNTREREMFYMAVHSMYHLLGYDHMTEEDKKIMREKEKAIMGQKR